MIENRLHFFRNTAQKNLIGVLRDYINLEKDHLKAMNQNYTN